MTEATKRLVLLRHGRTAWNQERRAQGHTDVPLDEVGRAQAAAAAPAVAALRPVALWSSDLARARETAAYVEAAGGQTAVVDPRLREYDLGERTGLTMPEYAASFPDEYAAFRQGRYEVVPGGESTATVTARVTAVLREALAALAPGECGVVVSHGGALKVPLVEVLGWPSGLAATVRGLDNCGWAELEDTGAGGALRLAVYNRVAGLEPVAARPRPKDFAPPEGVG